MFQSIEERACNIKLTNKESKVLDFILKDKEKTCFLTSNEIAENLNLSPSSVIRLSKKLGYENFAKFKKALQREVSQKGIISEIKEIPYEKLKQYENLSETDFIMALRQNVLNNIRRDFSSESDSKFIEVADMILNAKRVFITGFRICAGFANSFGAMLSCVRQGIFVISGATPVVDGLVDLGTDDVMIAISFKRYSKDTMFAVQMAKDAQCKVIAMTDSYSSPIASGASKVVINSIDNLSFYNSYVSLVMNMEIIVSLLGKKNKALSEERLKKMERYLEKTGQY